jgi:predicted nucleotidyltransferase
MRTATERATIERAGRALIEAVSAPSKVILFGSQPAESAAEGGDYKFLVVVTEVDDRFGEMARLDALLGGMLIPAEVVVVSAEQVEKTGGVKGTLIYQALKEGQVVAES